MADILIVDDEVDIRELIAGVLEDEGLEARLAGDAESALAEIRQRLPSLVILDIWLQGSRMDGIEILKHVKEEHPELPVVIISGHGNIEIAVEAMRQGAYDFIEKPFKADHLMMIVTRALETVRLRRENVELRRRAGADPEIVGASTVVRNLRSQIEKMAPTNSRVLISGPPGSGKEIAARLLHARSRRAEGPFVAVSCATISPDRMEEELFGVEQAEDGSRRIGLLERAHGGTLMLDEVADMPAGTQSKILRVLVDQSFERVGGGDRVKVDVRFVSTSSRELAEEIEEERFREDLYHRLNVMPLRAPALSERREDVPELVEHFMRQLSVATGLPARVVSEEAMAALQAHPWPGNVRQLRNVVEQLLILGAGEPEEAITADMLPAELSASAPAIMRGSGRDQMMSLPLREARELFEREYLAAQINRFSGNISRTAAYIGMERSALHRKLKSLRVTTGARD